MGQLRVKTTVVSTSTASAVCTFPNNYPFWRNPYEIFVKKSNRWKPVEEVWYNDDGEWQLVWPNNTGTVYLSETEYGTFEVPPAVYSLRITWPVSSDGYISKTLSVKPGALIPYNIGNWGEPTTFGSVTTLKYDKTVGKFKGLVDYILRNQYGVAQAVANTYRDRKSVV